MLTYNYKINNLKSYKSKVSILGVASLFVDCTTFSTDQGSQICAGKL